MDRLDDLRRDLEHLREEVAVQHAAAVLACQQAHAIRAETAEIVALARAAVAASRRARLTRKDQSRLP